MDTKSWFIKKAISPGYLNYAPVPFLLIGPTHEVYLPPAHTKFPYCHPTNLLSTRATNPISIHTCLNDDFCTQLRIASITTNRLHGGTANARHASSKGIAGHHAPRRAKIYQSVQAQTRLPYRSPSLQPAYIEYLMTSIVQAVAGKYHLPLWCTACRQARSQSTKPDPVTLSHRGQEAHHNRARRAQTVCNCSNALW